MELSMEETATTSFNLFMVQEIYGDRDVTAVSSPKIEAFFSFQSARDCDANAYCNVKLLDQHHKLLEQNNVVMLILLNQLVMLICY